MAVAGALLEELGDPGLDVLPGQPAVVVGIPRASKATNWRALRWYLSSVADELPPARRWSSHPRMVEARSKLPAVILAAVLPALATSCF